MPSGRKKTRARGKKMTPVRIRQVFHLSELAVQQLGIASTMERMNRRDWLEKVIAEHARRYVVQVRDPADSPREAGPGERAA